MNMNGTNGMSLRQAEKKDETDKQSGRHIPYFL